MAGSSKSLSLETAQKLANIFLQISIHESETENFRYSLSKNPDFDPYSAFKALDKLDLNSLSSCEFQAFLEKFHFFCTADEAYLLVRQYDSDLNGRLCFKEFLNLVLPCTNHGIKELAMSRSGKFTQEVEFLLSKLIEQEIRLHRELEGLKREIILRSDFNLMQAFDCVGLSGSICREDMLRFLARFFKVFDYDVDAIFRRVDNDADGVLAYNEFVDCVMPTRVTVNIEVIPVVTRYESNPFRNSSPLRNPEISFKARSLTPSTSFPSKSASSLRPQKLPASESTSLTSFHKKSVRFNNPFSNSSSTLKATSYNNTYRPSEPYSTGSFNNSNKSPFRQSQKPLSILKETLPTIIPRQRLNKPSELVNLIPVFQDYIKAVRQLEAVKNTLALRHDFNINSAFSLFDQYNVGIISVSELQSTLSSNSFKVSSEDLLLLVKYCSRLQDNRLRFSDFCELFTPRTEEYSRILKSRSSSEYSDKLNSFSQETLNIFLNAFNLLVDIERVLENHRQRLAQLADFDTLSAFNCLDRDRNGFVSQIEFSEALSSFNVPFNCKDLLALVQRFDKNCDGRVSYSEFVEEITPKAVYKY